MSVTNLAGKKGKPLKVNGGCFHVDDIVRVARGYAPVSIDPETTARETRPREMLEKLVELHEASRAKLLKSREIVKNILAQEQIVYGVTNPTSRIRHYGNGKKTEEF